MREFFTWFHEKLNFESMPWLLLGKGPSFNKREEFNLKNYFTLGLNHVVREMQVDIAHAIDIEVVISCAEKIRKNAKYLLLPWVPHCKNVPTKKTLADYLEELPVLKELSAEGRLLYYNLTTSGISLNETPTVKVKYFSAEAALRLLAMANVKTVRTLGIDGGASYCNSFEDLRNKTLLANGRSSFDKQFEEIATIINEYKLDFSPLDVPSPVRVFVATTDAQMLATKVLEYSIKKYASISVEVIPIHRLPISIPTPKDKLNWPRTPFSFQRFVIPEAVNFEGRAIYLDSDMQVFSDIRKLWTLPFNGANILAVDEPVKTGRRPQFSVMLLDCSSLKWNIEDIVKELDQRNMTYEQLMYDMVVADRVSRSIHESWNCLERYEEGNTSLLHYTDMATQPWVYVDHPLGYLWVRDLLEAIDSGVITMREIDSEIKNGYIRPSLKYQIEQKIADGVLLPKNVKKMDDVFRAPFRDIHKHGASAWKNPIARIKAITRYYYNGSIIQSLSSRVKERINR